MIPWDKLQQGKAVSALKTFLKCWCRFVTLHGAEATFASHTGHPLLPSCLKPSQDTGWATWRSLPTVYLQHTSLFQLPLALEGFGSRLYPGWSLLLNTTHQLCTLPSLLSPAEKILQWCFYSRYIPPFSAASQKQPVVASLVSVLDPSPPVKLIFIKLVTYTKKPFLALDTVPRGTPELNFCLCVVLYPWLLDAESYLESIKTQETQKQQSHFKNWVSNK